MQGARGRHANRFRFKRPKLQQSHMIDDVYAHTKHGIVYGRIVFSFDCERDDYGKDPPDQFMNDLKDGFRDLANTWDSDMCSKYDFAITIMEYEPGDCKVNVIVTEEGYDAEPVGTFTVNYSP